MLLSLLIGLHFHTHYHEKKKKVLLKVLFHYKCLIGKSAQMVYPISLLETVISFKELLKN